ncbi:MAG: arylamine N-acetyltransferase [Pyrinomonadaceae bacterium]
MDIPAYLDRIEYRGPLNRDAETLRQLHLAHLRAVPFENLSIHAGEPIILDDDALFEKIVKRNRGGFCYELNGLFAALLRELSYEVRMLSAQVADSSGGFSPDFDHMALLVKLDTRWLVDVGFGDSFIEPLLIDEREAQAEGGRAYRIKDSGEYLVLMKRSDENHGEWMSQYRFNLNTYAYADYAERCRYHQTWPDSHFTQNRICSRLTAGGRISLSDTRFISNENGVRSEYSVSGRAEYEQLLREHFGIVL